MIQCSSMRWSRTGTTPRTMLWPSVRLGRPPTTHVRGSREQLLSSALHDLKRDLQMNLIIRGVSKLAVKLRSFCFTLFEKPCAKRLESACFEGNGPSARPKIKPIKVKGSETLERNGGWIDLSSTFAFKSDLSMFVEMS